jgi:hypothetical protein
MFTAEEYLSITMHIRAVYSGGPIFVGRKIYRENSPKVHSLLSGVENRKQL